MFLGSVMLSMPKIFTTDFVFKPCSKIDEIDFFQIPIIVGILLTAIFACWTLVALMKARYVYCITLLLRQCPLMQFVH